MSRSLCVLMLAALVVTACVEVPASQPGAPGTSASPQPGGADNPAAGGVTAGATPGNPQNPAERNAPVASPAVATAVQTAAPASPVGTEAPSYPLYGRADDWSWVAGQILPLMGPAACWQLQYDLSTGATVALAQLPEGVAEAEFVVLIGGLQSAAGTACAGHAKIFVARQVVQVAPPSGSNPAGSTAVLGASADVEPPPMASTGAVPYGHADDYSWLAGYYNVTRIQGGCAYIVYNPAGDDRYRGSVHVAPLAGVASGTWVLVYGRIETGPAEMCPGQAYTVERVERQ